MIENEEMLTVYLDSLINRIFKILPLYEEKNKGVHLNSESLLFELYGLEKVVKIDCGDKYISLLSTLESVSDEILKEDGSKKVVKRELFKSIGIVRDIMNDLEKS